MTTSEATFYDLSLSSDQGLRYSLAAMLIKTHMPAGAIPEAAQALFEFVKSGPKAATGFASGYVSSPFCSPSGFASGTFGQTDELRNGEPQRG